MGRVPAAGATTGAIVPLAQAPAGDRKQELFGS